MGLVNLVTLLSGLFIPLYSLGIDASYSMLFFDHYKEKQGIKKLLSTALLLLLGIGTLSMLTIALFREQLLPVLIKSTDELTLFPYLFFALVMPLFTQVYNLFQANYRNSEDLKSYSALNIVSLLFMTGCSLYAVIYLDLKSYGAVTGRGIGYCSIVLLFVMIHFFRNGIQFDSGLAKKLLVVGFPVFIYIIIGQINYNIDRIFVEKNFSLSELGVFGLAMVIASVVEIWIGALSNALSPAIYRLLKEPGPENDAGLRKIFQLQFLSTLLVIAVVIAAAPFIMEHLISEQFIRAVDLIPVLALAFIGRALYVNYVAILFAGNKTKPLPWINIFTLAVAVISNLVLINLYGLVGVAWATFITKLAQVPLVIYFAKKERDFWFDFKRNYFLSAILTVAVTGLYFIDREDIGSIIYFFPLICVILFTVLFYKKECIYFKEQLINWKTA